MSKKVHIQAKTFVIGTYHTEYTRKSQIKEDESTMKTMGIEINLVLGKNGVIRMPSSLGST